MPRRRRQVRQRSVQDTLAARTPRGEATATSETRRNHVEKERRSCARSRRRTGLGGTHARPSTRRTQVKVDYTQLAVRQPDSGNDRARQRETDPWKPVGSMQSSISLGTGRSAQRRQTEVGSLSEKKNRGSCWADQLDQLRRQPGASGHSGRRSCQEHRPGAVHPPSPATSPCRGL